MGQATVIRHWRFEDGKEGGPSAPEAAVNEDTLQEAQTAAQTQVRDCMQAYVCFCVYMHACMYAGVCARAQECNLRVSLQSCQYLRRRTYSGHQDELKVV